LQSVDFVQVSVGPAMSQCLHSGVPPLSLICELNDGFEQVMK